MTESFRVLLVDDDQFLLDIYSTKFKQGAFEVTTATNGEEALEKMREKKDLDGVILDMVMPSMDGVTLLKKVREEKLLPTAAFIVLSNQGQQSDIDKASQFNIDGYIVKASTIPSEVLEEVTSILQKKKSSHQ